MKITIDNRDLSYTIDTYGMFTGESCEEGEREYYQETYNLTDDEWRDLEFDYDHPAVVRSLAESSVDILHNEFVTHGNGIVRSIDIEDTRSPQFYNYTTDSYKAIWDINSVKLKLYCRDNGFEAWLSEQQSDGNWSDVDSKSEDYIVAMLDFYTSREFDREQYEDRMFECESEAWSEGTKLSDESQKMIDQKEAKQ